MDVCPGGQVHGPFRQTLRRRSDSAGFACGSLQLAPSQIRRRKSGSAGFKFRVFFRIFSDSRSGTILPVSGTFGSGITRRVSDSGVRAGADLLEFASAAGELKTWLGEGFELGAA